MLARLALVLSGYLSGSISFSYLAGRLLRGIDLRRYGSRTLGGSNVYYHVWRPAVVIVGLLDIGKAVLPTWATLRLGIGLPTALATGLAAILGHNWSLFLGFKGGRGISTCMGVLLVVFPWGFPWLLGFLAIGRLWKAVAVFALLGFLTLPFFAQGMNQPTETIMACGAMCLIMIAKRLEANREPLPKGAERRPTLLRRFFLDRDVADAEAWIKQRPPLNSTFDSQR